MINAVDVSSAKCKRGEAVDHRFGGYYYDVGQAAFAVSDQIQRLRSAVLSAITTHCEFCRNAGMEDRFPSVSFSNISHSGSCVVYHNEFGVDLLVF